MHQISKKYHVESDWKQRLAFVENDAILSEMNITATQAEHRLRWSFPTGERYLRLLARSSASCVWGLKADSESGTRNGIPLTDATIHGVSYMDPIRSWSELSTQVAQGQVFAIRGIMLRNERSNL